MSLLKGKLIFDLTRRQLSTSTVRQVTAWNKDWKPGPVPKTDAEKLAAAKKYGLFPQEYEVTPDDGMGSGDYPNFKEYSVESRDPFYPWDYPEYRRNHGEAIIEKFNMYTEDRYHVNMRPRFSGSFMLMSFLSAMGLATFLFYALEDTFFVPAMPPHLPADGQPHYKYPSSGSGSH